MELLEFLFSVFLISLSGVMAPGPVTAVTLDMGMRSRHAGAVVAIGHGIVEFPLIVLITVGMSTILRYTGVKIGIGLAGGTFLLLMAMGMLKSLGKEAEQTDTGKLRSPLWAGIILSAGNPYFLFWWATVGLTLATKARTFGVWAFAIFALLHWMCDLVWLWALSWAGYKGSVLMGRKLQRAVLVICGCTLLIFGCIFIGDAGVKLVALVRGG